MDLKFEIKFTTFTREFDFKYSGDRKKSMFFVFFSL